MHIFDEVKHFRDAIDIAKESGEFRTIYPFLNFPKIVVTILVTY